MDIRIKNRYFIHKKILTKKYEEIEREHHYSNIKIDNKNLRKDIFDINVQGTENVLKAAKSNNIDRVVFISSTAVYGVPEKHPLYEDDPIEGARVYLLSVSGVLGYGTTNEFGEYDIRGVTVGVYNLRAEAAGYETYEIESVSITPAGAQRDFVLMEEPVDCGAQDKPEPQAFFGKVVQGMDVVDKIVNTPTTSKSRFRDVPKKDVVILKAYEK